MTFCFYDWFLQQAQERAGVMDELTPHEDDLFPEESDAERIGG